MAISDSQLSIVTVTFASWLERLECLLFWLCRAGPMSRERAFFEPPAFDATCLVIRGELAIGRGTARHTLVFGGSDADPNHDAVIRIGVGLQPTGLTRGETPRRRAHSLRRRASHACLGSPPPRTVMGIVVTLSTGRPISLGRLLHHGASRCPTQNHAFRNFPGRHQPPKGDKQLAGQGDYHGLAGAAAGICRLPLIPLHQRALLLEH